MTERPEQDVGEAADDSGPVELRADVTRREGEPDECTIWPHDASGGALLTQWISAEEGSFVSLEDAR